MLLSLSNAMIRMSALEGTGAVLGNFGIWQVDEATKASLRLEIAESATAEAMLEDVFVRNPAMLMPGLELVGRQLQTANGILDLLGVDSEGRLTLFELKRGDLTRKAVTQGVDYASWLDSLDEAELWKRISENSGQQKIDAIENFEAWYEDHADWDSLDALRPVRIVLVGLGADESARRMVDWLVAKGVEIDLLAFAGYRCGDRMLLARQLEDGGAARRQARQRQETGRRAEIRLNRQNAIDAHVDENGMRDWWRDAVTTLGRDFRSAYRANLGITFYKQKARPLSTGVGARGSHKIEIAKPDAIRIVFLPAAVDLCVDEFEELKQVIPFDLEPPPNAPTTERVTEQWFCRLDDGRWREHKNSIKRLVRLVDERWGQAAG